ncbi:conserved hypothetical protein [Candidatus Sulfopaludibacter sp. SbA3]|nr:conserved hypothetical protein [Candidatus Sulfopaludibacter sp. SbA3]
MPGSQCAEERRIVQWVAKGELPGLIRRKVMPAQVVMDVGSGIRPQTLVWPRVHICVEVHDEYVKYLCERLSGSPRYLVVHSPWEDALRTMASKSVDSVIALDFIEHLSKDDGWTFLAQAERIARRQVVLFTPLGYIAQSYEGAEAKDRWGMHGGYWQTHRSGWTPDDFSEDWEIIGCRDYHVADQHGPLDQPIGCIWAIRTFGSMPGGGHIPIGRLESQLWLKTMTYRHFPGWFLSPLRRIKRLLAPARA